MMMNGSDLLYSTYIIQRCYIKLLIKYKLTVGTKLFAYIQRESKKRHYTLVHIFAKY